MKKTVISIFAVLSLVACNKGVQLEVSNSLPIDRNEELVEISTAQLNYNPEESHILLDADGKEINYQIMRYGQNVAQSIVFQASVPANSSSIYTWKKGTPKTFKAKTFARYVPERKDDFAWENDKCAYRMYGPALANENPSNGVDIWLKRTPELVVDTFYHNELQLGQSYHVDHGKGLDCYKVGNKLGAGGIAPLANDTLWVGKHYDRQELIETGSLRSVFALEYDSVRVGNAYFTQRIVITTDAGSQVNKAEVSYVGPTTVNMKLAAGIWLHSTVDNYRQDFKNKWIAYAENAVSDAGIPVGRNYIAAIVPDMTGAEIKDETLLAYAPYTVGEKFTYYFGGGWSQWGYPTDEDWFAATNQTALCLQTPLIVNVVSK